VSRQGASFGRANRKSAEYGKILAGNVR